MEKGFPPGFYGKKVAAFFSLSVEPNACLSSRHEFGEFLFLYAAAAPRRNNFPLSSVSVFHLNLRPPFPLSSSTQKPRLHRSLFFNPSLSQLSRFVAGSRCSFKLVLTFSFQRLKCGFAVLLNNTSMDVYFAQAGFLQNRFHENRKGGGDQRPDSEFPFFAAFSICCWLNEKPPTHTLYRQSA